MFLFKILFTLFDLVLIFAAYLSALKIRFSSSFVLEPYFSFSFFENGNLDYLLFICLINWLFLIVVLDLMHVPRTIHQSNVSFWKYLFYPQLIFVMVLFMAIIFLNYDYIPRLFLLIFIILEFSFLSFAKLIRSKIFTNLRISGFDLLGIGIISNDQNIDNIKIWLKNNPKAGFYLKNLQLNDRYLKTEQDQIRLIELLQSGDYLLIDKNDLSSKQFVTVKDIAENKGMHIYEIYNDNSVNINDSLDYVTTKIGPFKLIKLVKTSAKNPINIINKRIFDFTFSLLFLILIYWWVFLLVSLIIKIQSKGPIIFKQERVGINGEIFMCYKFRTMHIDSSNSKLITQIGDNRIFTFGNFMRKTNIDEFPQFINVLKGDMSVVGPRPHMVSEDNSLAEIIDKYRIRRWVKPGITGYAAVNGYRGGTESMDLMQKRIDLDVEYIEKWSFWLDIKICFKTAIMTILNRSGGH